MAGVAPVVLSQVQDVRDASSRRREGLLWRWQPSVLLRGGCGCTAPTCGTPACAALIRVAKVILGTSGGGYGDAVSLGEF